MPSQLSLANFSRKLASLFRQKRSKSNSSKKNKSATKIQSTFRGRATRRKLEAKKLETQAEHLFCKSRAARAKAAKALDDMARDVDEEGIDIMVYHLWRDLSNKEHAKWIAKAKKKLTQQNKNATINPVSE